jgi:ubiquinone/menaquinone biosynthesis C-methylase UbiE
VLLDIKSHKIRTDMTLNDLGIMHGTDKSSSGHGYMELYETPFEPMRHTACNILEIGVHTGASLRVWRDYFPLATIIGVDINSSALACNGDRINIPIADQSNRQQMESIGNNYKEFDIIIDDGSHFWDHQIISLQTMLKFVRPGGFYIIEDIDTSYGDYVKTYSHNQEISCADYLKLMLDRVIENNPHDSDSQEDFIANTYKEIKYMLFSKHVVIIKTNEKI